LQRSDVCCSVGVYYLRAKYLGYEGMVCHLREMLALEAKDKEFLLNKITMVTENCK